MRISVALNNRVTNQHINQNYDTYKSDKNTTTNYTLFSRNNKKKIKIKQQINFIKAKWATVGIFVVFVSYAFTCYCFCCGNNIKLQKVKLHYRQELTKNKSWPFCFSCCCKSFLLLLHFLLIARVHSEAKLKAATAVVYLHI